MVQLQNFLKNTNGSQNDRHFPMLNSLFLERFSMFGQNSKDTNFKTFIKYARRSPQLMGFIDIIATDMLSDGVEFTAMNKSLEEIKFLMQESSGQRIVGSKFHKQLFMIYLLLELDITG